MLEKRNVDNAIIMAAGMSSRFAPLSFEKPKALLVVKGEVLIERQIMQLKEAGIQKIIIVVGYLKEQFEYLKEQYGVILLENSQYAVRNNHSTLFVAKDFLKNTYICSGDNYYTENLFRGKEIKSYYCAVYREGNTMEWCMDADDDGRIIDVKVGGEDCWIMQGFAFFTEEFSRQLLPYLEAAYKDEKAADMYWEDIYVNHIDDMELYQRNCMADEIWEFDSLDELKNFDTKYINDSGSKILQRICKMLQCEEMDLTDIGPIKNGADVKGIRLKKDGKIYEYDYDLEKLQIVEKIGGIYEE